MKLKKSLLKRSQLYLILDRSALGSNFLKSIKDLVSGGGISLVQLRDKLNTKANVLSLANKLSSVLAPSKTLFIVNDYVDVALAAQADGVHLGQTDCSLKQARKILGRDKIIGISCHNLRQALIAQKEGADYIGVGPIYTTATKPGYKAVGLEVLRELKDKIRIPYFAIGNIGQDNIQEVTGTGARRIAVCRAVLQAKDPKSAAKQLLKRLK
jgi:thiamine-phosphate pyrophosphorylase